jgi:hypothetical protein
LACAAGWSEAQSARLRGYKPKTLKEHKMPKFIIRYNAGYGDEYDVVEAPTFEDAETEAYEAWKEAAEASADYGAEEYTEELAEDYGL